eukprot:7073-Rhodomonas_salina.1
MSIPDIASHHTLCRYRTSHRASAINTLSVPNSSEHPTCIAPSILRYALATNAGGGKEGKGRMR